MKFVPRVNVVYHGEFHRTDEAFEIDAADAEEMGFLGCIENNAECGMRNAELSTQEDTQEDTQDEPETVKHKTTGRKKASK